MRVHFIQHVSFEGPGCLDGWFADNGFDRKVCRIFEGDSLPEPEQADWLVILGGPMGTGDEHAYPWLKEEKSCISSFIAENKIVLGICLGAQLIAEVMGADVQPGKFMEIGWHPLYKVHGTGECCLRDILPDDFPAFHWHGDRFGIPDGAVHFLSSKGCRNQAFSFEDRVFAFQFHLETTPDSAALLVENAGDDLETGGLFVQSEEFILSPDNPYDEINSLMNRILDAILSLRKN